MTAPLITVGAMAYRVPQPLLEAQLDACRARFHAALEGTLRLLLVIDGTEGLVDLAGLAARTDVLSFARERRGFGVARSTALAHARIDRCDWVVLMDADGLHRAEAVAGFVAAALRGGCAAAIPQRTLVHLPVAGGETLDRRLAERFEGYCVACCANRTDLAWMDFQPGVFLLSREAVELLAPVMGSRGYSWDLEACWRLMAAERPLLFPSLETQRQAVTSFTADDSRGNLRYLARLLGADRMRVLLDHFAIESRVREEFAAEAIMAHAEFARGALEEVR